MLRRDTALGTGCDSIPIGLSSKELAQLRLNLNASRPGPPNSLPTNVSGRCPKGLKRYINRFQKKKNVSPAATTGRDVLGGMAETAPLPEVQRLQSEKLTF